MTDDFSDSFYYRAIRTKIGEALRDRLVPKEMPPKRLLDLLKIPLPHQPPLWQARPSEPCGVISVSEV